MVMHWIIQEWIAQWLGVRDRLRTPRDRADQADGWWLGIRERILRFLVSRYVDEAEGDDDRERPPFHESSPPPIPLERRRVYCRVTPEDHPPRTCADMQGKLRRVSRINANKRWRWRLF